MSISRTAADLVEEAGLPCHHRREPFGPCEICLEDQINEFINGMVPEEELTIAKANLEEAEAEHRADDGLLADMRKKFDELKDRMESVKSELGEELASVRSDLLDKMTKLIDEAENPEDNL